MARAGASVSMKWHQMTNCGRVLLGAYCHHLHFQGQAGGTFVGIATMHSVNKVWSIHGTSGSVIKDSVVFHHRGAIVYFENGAEFGNTLMGNVFGCEWMLTPADGVGSSKCALGDGVSTQVDSDFAEQSGVYQLSPFSADVLGCRIFGMDNAHFANQQGNTANYGSDAAAYQVAPSVMPNGKWEYNVFHSNAGFGFYWNSALHPLEHMLRDWFRRSCARAQFTFPSTCALTQVDTSSTGETRCPFTPTRGPTSPSMHL